MTEQTYGERAVGLSFNPSQYPAVDQLKRLFAQAIDVMNDLRNVSDNLEIKRLASVAITEAQTAQMWAIKAITSGVPTPMLAPALDQAPAVVFGEASLTPFTISAVDAKVQP